LGYKHRTSSGKVINFRSKQSFNRWKSYVYSGFTDSSTRKPQTKSNTPTKDISSRSQLGDIPGIREQDELMKKRLREGNNQKLPNRNQRSENYSILLAMEKQGINIDRLDRDLQSGRLDSKKEKRLMDTFGSNSIGELTQLLIDYGESSYRRKKDHSIEELREKKWIKRHTEPEANRLRIILQLPNEPIGSQNKLSEMQKLDVVQNKLGIVNRRITKLESGITRYTDDATGRRIRKKLGPLYDTKSSLEKQAKDIKKPFTKIVNGKEQTDFVEMYRKPGKKNEFLDSLNRARDQAEKEKVQVKPQTKTKIRSSLKGKTREQITKDSIVKKLVKRKIISDPQEFNINAYYDPNLTSSENLDSILKQFGNTRIATRQKDRSTKNIAVPEKDAINRFLGQSKRSQTPDLKSTSKKTYDSPNLHWYNNPGKSDVKGIDTKGVKLSTLQKKVKVKKTRTDSFLEKKRKFDRLDLKHRSDKEEKQYQKLRKELLS
jgi:hypothetical protein